MKKIFLLILMIISVAAIHSCKKPTVGPGNTPKGIYVSGTYMTSDTIISGTTIHRIGGGRIAVSGSDIYLTGGVDYYWKNGTQIPMEPPLAFQPVNTELNDIVLSGSDVYVVVWEHTFCQANVTRIAKYWKNGKAILLTGSNTCAAAHAIAVSGSDVYVAGSEYNSDRKEVAKYWKNGNPIPLTDGSIFILVRGIAVSGSDVYVAGSEWNGTRYNAKYWKNGNPIPLTDGSKWSEATGITVSGSDVYVLGFEQEPNGIRNGKYWKNGTSVPLAFPDGSRATAQPNDITVSGNDVYVAGYILSGSTVGGGGGFSVTTAVYWKNGTPVTIGNGPAYGIAVVP